MDQTTDDLRVTSGLEFSSEGDYTRNSITIDNGANLYCSTVATLNISTIGDYTDSGSTWTCSAAISTINFAVTGALNASSIVWNFSNTDTINLSANTFTTAGVNVFTVSKAGAQTHWNIAENLTLNNLTYNGPKIGSSSYQGGVLFIDDPIEMTLVNSDINSSVSWTGISGLSMDATSSINANGMGCSGAVSSLEGFGPNLLNENYVCGLGGATGVEGAGRSQYGGGGHCSAGAASYGPASTTYDSATAPFLPGSGGAGMANQGSYGGGTVRLSMTNNFALNGTITANAIVPGGHQGGGSGGSVWINASTVSGAGTVAANGYAGSGFGGPGGAGYIALYYDTLSGFSASQLQSNGVTGFTSNCTPYVSLNPEVSVSPTSGLITTESGGTDQFTVVLSTQPTSDVTISVASSNTQAGTVSTSSLVFTSSNWSQSQEVTVTGVDDHIAGGSTPYTIDMTATSADSAYNGITVPSVSATNTDNDIAGITVAPTTITAVEGGSNGEYEVVLNTQPTHNVVIHISPDSHVTVDLATLTFTSANWDSPQTVTVTAVNDHGAEGPHTGTVTQSATSSDSNYNGASVSSVTVSITDNDTAGVTISPTIINATEGGATGEYEIVLNTEPTQDVTVQITPDSQVTVDVTTVTFTSSNWSEAQTVTVTAVDDVVSEGLHIANITHSSSSSDSNYNNLTLSTVVVNITDNDSAGVSIDSSTLSINEGASGSYTVVLTTEPTASVSVTPSTTSSRLTLSPSTLTFTASDWETPQTVTVAASADNTVTGVVTATITHSATSADSYYNGISIASLAVQINDQDVPEIELPDPADSGAVTIVDHSLVYGVLLSSPSAETVTVQYATTDGTAVAGVDYIASEGVLTWSPGETGVKTVSIELLGDFVQNLNPSFSFPFIATAHAEEVQKTIILQFSDPSQANLGGSSVTLTITGSSTPATTEDVFGGGCRLSSLQMGGSKVILWALGITLVAIGWTRRLKIMK